MNLFSLFYFWSCFANGMFLMPEPTPQVNNLIIKLGDNSFAAREKAEKELCSLEIKALWGVYCAVNHQDLEIAKRSSRIVEDYFNLYNAFPPIWHLDNKIRFPNGYKTTRFASYSGCSEIKEFDLGKHYYLIAREIINETVYSDSQWKLADYDWRNDHVETLATRLYAYDLLFMGKSRKDVIKVLENMTKSSKERFNLLQQSNEPSPYEYLLFPPGPTIPLKQVVPQR